VNSPGAAGGGGGGGATGVGGAGFSTGAETGELTLAGGAAGRGGAGGGGAGANGGAGGDCGADAGRGALFAGFPAMELKSRVNSPPFFAGGGGGGGTAGAAGGGAGGALGVAAMGCVNEPVALAAAGGGATGGGGGGGATFPAPPPPARIGCVDPKRGCGASGRRIVTLICFAAPAPADAPPGVCDDIHTSSDSNPCRNCVTTTGCPSTSSVSTTFRRSISGSARTRARTALFSSVLPTR